MSRKFEGAPARYYEPPAEPTPPVCPVCGAETDTFMRDHYGEICGCDNCVKPVDAWDYTEDE